MISNNNIPQQTFQLFPTDGRWPTRWRTRFPVLADRRQRSSWRISNIFHSHFLTPWVRTQVLQQIQCTSLVHPRFPAHTSDRFTQRFQHTNHRIWTNAWTHYGSDALWSIAWLHNYINDIEGTWRTQRHKCDTINTESNQGLECVHGNVFYISCVSPTYHPLHETDRCWVQHLEVTSVLQMFHLCLDSTSIMSMTFFSSVLRGLSVEQEVLQMVNQHLTGFGSVICHLLNSC